MPKLTLRLRLFMTMLLIFLLPMGILGGVGSYWARRAVMENASVSYQNTLENVASRLEEDMVRMEMLAITLSKDALVYRIAWMQGDEIDYARLERYDIDMMKNQLSLYCNQSGLYSNMALCFPQKDFVLSTRGSWKLEWLWTDEFSIEGMVAQDWLDMLHGRDELFFLPNVRMSTFGFMQNGTLSVQIPIKTATQQQPLLAVLFWIDDAALQAYLQELAVFPGVVAAITDAEGTPVAVMDDSDGRMTAYLNSGSHGQRIEAEGGAYRVMQTGTKSLGWSVTALLSEQMLFAQARQLTTMWLVMLGILLVVGGALSYELALLNYRPLEGIFRLFSTENADPTRDEMARVETLLGELMADQDRLRERVASSRDLLQYAALAHLLQGEPAPDEDLLHTLELPMPYAYYTVGALRWSNGVIAEHVVQASRREGVNAYWIRHDEYSLLLFNHQEPGLMRAVAGRLEEIPVVLGLSEPCDAREGLPEARQEALKALDYRPVQPGARIIFFGDVQDAGFAVYYPLEKEQLVLNALRVGETDKAMALFEALLYRNAQDNPSRQALRMFILAVELTALKADDANTGISKALQALPPYDADDLTAVKAHVQSIFEQAAQQRASLSQKQDNFYTELQNYLDEHLCDPQLSLKHVADYFGMSTAALSQYIKEHMSMGYLEYVNRKRIILAKQILREGNCSVKIAAENVGFSNDVTFRRLFKKYEGITPSQSQNM